MKTNLEIEKKDLSTLLEFLHRYECEILRIIQVDDKDRTVLAKFKVTFTYKHVNVLYWIGRKIGNGRNLTQEEIKDCEAKYEHDNDL